MNSKSVNVEEREIFLGFKAYTESDADIFKGRSQDTEYLYDLVANKDYVLCYAESGEGKSSLIDAGLTPRLRANRYFPVKISFTDDDFNDNDINFDSLIKSRIIEAINNYQTADNGQMLQSMLSFQPKSDSIFNEKYSDDLWWFLRNNTLSLYGMPLTLVMIFDQFEEVLNYPKSNVWTNRFFAFLEKISSDNCPQYILDDIDKTLETCEDVEFPDIMTKKNFKAVFSIRTEYIGELDYWCMQRYFIPDLKHNRFCLKALTMQGADEIMRQYEGFDDELCDNIKAIIVKEFKNTTSNVQNVMDNCVSALILSVVCTSLYNNREKILTKSFITDSIENFYNDIIAKCNISIEERNVIASVLVDKDKRVRVASDCSALEKIGFNKKYKDALLQNRLIKKSSVNGVEYIELVHDSLIDIVKKHKEEALQKELRTRRRRNMTIFSFLLSIVLILVFLILGFKKNEKNYLITQAKYIAAEAEKLAEEGDRYDCIRLLKHVAENNRMSLKTPDFEHAIRSLDCNYKFPEKNWLYASYIKTIVFSPDGEKILITSNNSRINDYTSKIWSVESGECLQSIKHTHFVTMGEYSPIGEYVVTASDSFSKIWSAKDGKCIQTMLHNGKVNSSKFSPDGKYVVTASDDKTSKLWSVESGECLDTMQHEARVESATFSPDGRYIVTMSDKTTKLWDVESKKCLQTKKYDISLYSANFTPNSSYVITRVHSHKYDKSYCSLWDIENGENMLDTITDLHSIKFSPSHKYVVTATKEGDVKMWMNGNCDFLHDIHNVGSADRVSFSHDEKYILTCSEKMVRLWSINKGKYIDSIPHNKYIRFARFSPDSKYIITTTIDHNVRLWLVESEDICSEINRDFNEIVEISPDDKYILTKSKQNDTLVKFWSVEDMKCIKYMQHEEAVTSARFSPKGDYLLTVSNGKNSNNVNLWSIENKECVHTMEYNNWISSAEFSSDGKIIVAADNNSKSHNVVLWSVDGRVCLDAISFKEWVDYVEFGFDTSFIIIKSKGKLMVRKNGKQLDALSDTNNYRIIKFSKDDNKVFISESGQPYLKLLSLEDEIIIDTINKDKEYVSSLSISPNGEYVVTASDSFSKIWSAKDGKCIQTMLHNGKVNSSKFSPDGRYIVTASDDNTSKLWSVESGECLQTIQHEDDVKSAVFSPDGRYIVTASDDKVRIIPIKPLSEILDKWSETLGPDAELTKEEKAKYFLN